MKKLSLEQVNKRFVIGKLYKLGLPQELTTAATGTPLTAGVASWEFFVVNRNFLDKWTPGGDQADFWWGLSGVGYSPTTILQEGAVVMIVDLILVKTWGVFGDIDEHGIKELFREIPLFLFGDRLIISTINLDYSNLKLVSR